MSEAVEHDRERTDASLQSRQSIHERVMADPQSRYAYFNTTQGILRGNPAHKDMAQILRVLDDNRIVYLYDASTNRPRPVFYSQGNISIGLAEIAVAAAKLASAP